jgi:hypothetical protein
MKRGRKPKPELRPAIAAIHRLTADGASSNAAIRKRIALIAAERNLDPPKALMKGRWLRLRHLCQFAEKHNLSPHWLVSGDLRSHPRGTAPRPHFTRSLTDGDDAA